MIVKYKRDYLEETRKILHRQNGIILTSDLAKVGIPRTYLSILQRNGEVERISRGIYQQVNFLEDEMFNFQAQYKASIFSHETALYLHDLTDRTPLTYSITLPVGYHSETLKHSRNKVYYVNQKLFNIGIITVDTTHGNEIKTTNLERTIIDILRSRHRLDIQLTSEALKRYIRRRDMNIDYLYNLAGQFRVQQIVRQTLEILL